RVPEAGEGGGTETVEVELEAVLDERRLGLLEELDPLGIAEERLELGPQRRRGRGERAASGRGARGRLGEGEAGSGSRDPGGAGSGSAGFAGRRSPAACASAIPTSRR